MKLPQIVIVLTAVFLATNVIAAEKLLTIVHTNDMHSHFQRDSSSRVAVAIESNGVIRDDLLMGKTGMITVGDLFRAIPLGIGVDNTMAYPLISFYLYGYERNGRASFNTSSPSRIQTATAFRIFPGNTKASSGAL